MAKIKRSATKGVRRAAKTQSRAAGARRAKAKTTGVLDTVMSVLPFTEEQWSRIFMALIVLAGLAVVGTIATMAGVPALARDGLARFASDAGFSVNAVRITGTVRMDEDRVYALVMAQQDRAMTEVDIGVLRDEIKQIEWVEDARVSIQLPDTLAVDIVERVPHAVLQKPDRLVLIDKTGHELSVTSSEAAKDMLKVSGPGVSKRIEDLELLFQATPAIEAQVKSVEWVGNRRWNFTFDSGQVLALPEGTMRSVKALEDFAKLDGQYRLIGGKVTSFDMRNPPRIYMREPGRADRYELKTGNP